MIINKIHGVVLGIYLQNADVWILKFIRVEICFICSCSLKGICYWQFFFSYADRQQEPDGDPEWHLREGVGGAGHALRPGSEPRDAVGRPRPQAVWPGGDPSQHLPGPVSRDAGERLRQDGQSGDWRAYWFQKKIDKRGRKLIDFDKERHAVQQMQNNPNRNEAKFIKVKEQMENAKRTYEILNSELHDELPALHDSRILFLVTNMQTLFAAEEVFHSETSKVWRVPTGTSFYDVNYWWQYLQTFSELEAVVDKLAKEVQKGTLPRKTFPKPQPITNSVISHNNSSQNSTL